jgi:hypothetical protein
MAELPTEDHDGAASPLGLRADRQVAIERGANVHSERRHVAGHHKAPGRMTDWQIRHGTSRWPRPVRQSARRCMGRIPASSTAPESAFSIHTPAQNDATDRRLPVERAEGDFPASSGSPKVGSREGLPEIRADGRPAGAYPGFGSPALVRHPRLERAGEDRAPTTRSSSLRPAPARRRGDAASGWDKRVTEFERYCRRHHGYSIDAVAACASRFCVSANGAITTDTGPGSVTRSRRYR